MADLTHEDRSDPAGGGGLSQEEFQRSCQASGVPGSEVPLLWELWSRWKREGLSDRERFSELLHDFKHLELYRRSREGDDAAGAEFEKYWKLACSRFLAKGATLDQIEELAGRFFERVYRLVGPSYHWNCPFEIYLKTILLNLFRESGKKRTRRKRVEVSLDELGDSTGIEPEDHAAGPEARALTHELSVQIRDAVESLKPGDRHILRVCLLEGESGQELAKQLGISRDALYQRLSRAKKKLRKILESQGVRRGVR